MHAKHAILFDVYGTKTVNIAGDKDHFLLNSHYKKTSMGSFKEGYMLTNNNYIIFQVKKIVSLTFYQYVPILLFESWDLYSSSFPTWDILLLIKSNRGNRLSHR